MLVILAIAAIAILACVVLVSLGRGGELTEFPPDVPPLDLPDPGQLTAVDFMALQLPVNLVGYHTASVDETLRRAASAISARDTRIAVLEQRVSELLASRLHARQEVYAAPGAGLRTDHSPDAPAVARELSESGDPVSASGAAVSWDGGVELTRPPEDPEWRLPAPDAPTTTNGALATAKGESATADGVPATAEGDPGTAEGDPATANGESAGGRLDANSEEPSAGETAVARPDEPAEEPPAVPDAGLPEASAGLPDASADEPERATAEETDKSDEPGADQKKDGDGEEAEGREEPVRASSGKDADGRS
ncbi:hypothetical protein [Nonomuraea sp. SYSU D8015]|uniref:hypothetical protein n=1 Tax=Nonomuraea sp. SYSU D8015 TaxID=2593644 RepID=UPI0016616630|nr:hypothetical protein [Nonomuraea sp. SYSU D8015]